MASELSRSNRELRVTTDVQVATLSVPGSPSAGASAVKRSTSAEDRALAFADGIIPDQLPARPSGGPNGSSLRRKSENVDSMRKSVDYLDPAGKFQDKPRPSTDKTDEPEGMKKLSRRSIVKIVLILVFVSTAFALQFIPAVTKALVTALYWFYDNAAVGAVLLWLIYCIGTVFMIPGKTLLAIGVGYLYGFFGGFALLSTSSLTASNISFAIGRLYSDAVLRVCKKLFLKKWSESKWNALMKLLQMEGFKTCFAIRATPIPKEIAVPVFGAVNIKYTHFLGSAVIHVFFSNMILSLYAGSTAKSIQDVVSGKATDSTKINLGLTLGLLVVALILGFWIARRGKKYFDEAETIVERENTNHSVAKSQQRPANHHDRGESSTNPLSGQSIVTDATSNQSAIIKGSEASDEHLI